MKDINESDKPAYSQVLWKRNYIRRNFSHRGERSPLCPCVIADVVKIIGKRYKMYSKKKKKKKKSEDKKRRTRRRRGE